MLQYIAPQRKTKGNLIMRYYIENDFLKVGIESLGAELKSVLSKQDGFEYLWQGSEKSWNGSSPVLFPYCGRKTDNTLLYDGKTYEANPHGFLRKRELSVSAKSDSSITFTLFADEQTRSVFPFEFIFDITYSLEGKTLACTTKVTNPSESEPLYFSLGAHPGFNITFGGESDTIEDYALTFSPEKESIDRVDIKNFVASDTLYATALTDGKYLELSNEFFEIDQFFTNMPNTVTLRSRTSDRSIKMTYADFSYLGVWRPVGDAPFVCIEPWAGLPDRLGETCDFSEKLANMKLEPNSSRTFYYDVTIGG